MMDRQDLPAIRVLTACPVTVDCRVCLAPVVLKAYEACEERQENLAIRESPVTMVLRDLQVNWDPLAHPAKREIPDRKACQANRVHQV